MVIIEIPIKNQIVKSAPLKVEMKKGELLLLYTKQSKARDNTPILGEFIKTDKGDTRPYSIHIFIEDAMVLNVPIDYKGSIAICPTSAKKSYYNDYRYSANGLADIIVGKDKIEEHLIERLENWKLYADWISQMSK